MTPFRPTVAEVDLEAIRHNVGAIKPDGVDLLAVVKANAYGHGEEEVSLAALAAGATGLGVALVEEGIRLREAGIEAPILCLSEFPRGSEREALEARLTPALYTVDGLNALSDAARGLDPPPAVHVKIDTGMHRVGVYPPWDVAEIIGRVREAGLQIGGLWTHFARAEEDEETTRRQLKRFDEILGALTQEEEVGIVHAANTAATLMYPESHFDMVRSGLGIYGLGPAPDLAERNGLRPALSWRTAVTMTKRVPAGAAISYGHTYRLEHDTTIATIPVGYADGYPRSLSNKAEVLIRGRRRRSAGTVTMDQMLVDCGDEAIEPGEEAVLIGRQGDEEITSDELAGLAGTISYELLCGISARVPRQYAG
ncbi:MAG: alanine racemase [Actinomycetota bacterium]